MPAVPIRQIRRIPALDYICPNCPGYHAPGEPCEDEAGRPLVRTADDIKVNAVARWNEVCHILGADPEEWSEAEAKFRALASAYQEA